MRKPPRMGHPSIIADTFGCEDVALSMLTFQIEPLRDVQSDLERLFPLHSAETGAIAGGIDVDWPVYFAMEELGMVQALIVRAEGAVVGYFISFLRPHLHNRACLTAVSDMYFLHPEFRGHAGIQLFREVEKIWRARGVQLGAITCKMHRDHGPLFRRLGWRVDEEVYLKRF